MTSLARESGQQEFTLAVICTAGESTTIAAQIMDTGLYVHVQDAYYLTRNQPQRKYYVYNTKLLSLS